MPLTLWVMEASPPSWAVRMLADILGLELELKNVDFVAKEHKSPEFVKRNPMGTVPVLQDGDFYISESHTINKYLLEKYGGQKQKDTLYPSDIKARALVDQANYFDTGIAFIRVKLVALPAIFSGEKGLTPTTIAQVEEAYSIAQLYLERTRYAAADHLTLADLSLGTSIIALHNVLKVDATRFPRVVEWLALLEEEPYFKNIAVPGAAVLAKTINFFWEKNQQNK